jgi:hypothetical protein
MKLQSLLSLLSKATIFSAIVFLFASVARGETRTAQQGNVRVVISYQVNDSCITNARIRIIRGGQTLLNQPTELACRLSELRVRDLDRNREPEVIVDFYTGGTHCCYFSLIYRYDSSRRRYSYIKTSWLDYGYKLQDLDRDGVPEFNSADHRFLSAFTSFAGSGLPIQIWQYRQGRMIEVTRRYPHLIRRDANQWWQQYIESRNRGYEVKGHLAGYLADKYLIGEEKDGWERVQQAYQQSDRQQFFRELRSFLRQTGYIRGNSS